MTSTAGRLHIGELARRTGLSPAVLRAWEQRYGVIRPERSAGGTRLYSERDESRVRAMQTLMSGGLTAAEAARLVLSARPAGGSPPDGSRSTAPEPTELQASSAGLRAALARLDRAQAELALDRLLASFTFETLTAEVILPYLADVGRRWERGEASIAEEHLATNLLRSRLLSLAPLPQATPRASAVLACVAGEQHDIALVLLAVALERSGWRIAVLGADTPVTTIAEAADTMQADLIVVGATLAENLAAATAELQELASRRPVFLAGPGAGEAQARATGAVLLQGDPITAARWLDERHGDTRRAPAGA